MMQLNPQQNSMFVFTRWRHWLTVVVRHAATVICLHWRTLSQVAVMLGGAARCHCVRFARTTTAVRVWPFLGRVLTDSVQYVHVFQSLQQLMHVPVLTRTLSFTACVDKRQLQQRTWRVRLLLRYTTIQYGMHDIRLKLTGSQHGAKQKTRRHS